MRRLLTLLLLLVVPFVVAVKIYILRELFGTLADEQEDRDA